MNATSEQKVVPSEALVQLLGKYKDDQSLVVVTPDVAVVIDRRSEWGSSGGIGYWSQVIVFCNGQSKMQEWQWRDRYSANNDKPWLSVQSIGKVDVKEEGGKTVVRVELLNRDHAARSATYTFDPPKQQAVKILSENQQRAFVAKADQEVARIMEGLASMHKNKSPMVSSTSGRYVPYRQPSVKQRIYKPEFGVAAFVTEEQIDHDVDDAQIRYELYVLKADSAKAECMAEDHGYGREGGAFLTIVSVLPDRILINTKRGQGEVSLA